MSVDYDDDYDIGSSLHVDPNNLGNNMITDPATDPNTNPNVLGDANSPFKKGDVFVNQTPNISDLAGLKKWVTDNKGLLTAGGALIGMNSGSGIEKTGYQGGIPLLSATRKMISKPPTKEMGYRPGAGGIDYGGDVTYTRLAEGTDPWINLRGDTGSIAGANLTSTVTGAKGNDTIIGAIGNDTIKGGTGNDTIITKANPGSKGYQDAMKAGLTPAQYLNNINQWIIDNPRASKEKIAEAMNYFGVSQTDLQEALRTTTFSDATKYALTQGMGLQGLNNNISKWIADNPYATNEEIQKAMTDVGVNDTDVARAMIGLNSSRAKEYAVINDMGLDKLYKNILDYKAAGHSEKDIADVMSKYGVEQRDIDAANKYAAATGYKADATSYAGVGDYRPANEIAWEKQQAENARLWAAQQAENETNWAAQQASNTGETSGDSGVVSGGSDVVSGGTINTGGGNVDVGSSNAGSGNAIFDYFATPEVQAALASGNVADVLGTINNSGWSAADIASATGVSEAAVQSGINAASGYAQGGEIAMAKGRYLQGGTDGMADELPAKIGADQPAALSHGEFVIPADVVSHMGNGNSDAGAKKLYQMMDKIRMARTGNKKQGKKINPDKFMPGGLASAYVKGGSVKHFVGGGTTMPAGTTGTESSLSNWVGPYVTNMLGQGQALANMPYQAYQGPLTAGSSSLQDTAFKGLEALKTPSSISDAATTAGGYATKAGTMSYTPQTMDFLGNANQSGLTITPPAGTAGAGGTTTGATGIAALQPNNIAQQYMNPYLQSALNPQIEEARRQAMITQRQNAAKMTQAGGFGGSRQAILDAENQRNLGTNLSKITGEGYNTAYNKAMEQFNADQARKMAEGQFGATYGLDALKTGITGAQAQGVLGTQQSQADINTLNAQLTGGNVQRGIESEGIAADKAQFEEARANPYKMVQFQQSLLQGLPLDAQSFTGIQQSDLVKAAQGATTVAQLLKNLGITTPA